MQHDFRDATLGPGLLHSVYRVCVAQELIEQGYSVDVEKPVPLRRGTLSIECAFRVDLLVEDALVVEIKCVDKLMPVHRAQLLTYLRLTQCSLGLLINFKVAVLKEGIKRVVNDLRNRDGTLA